MKSPRGSYNLFIHSTVIERGIKPEWLDTRIAMLHFQEIDVMVDGEHFRAPRRATDLEEFAILVSDHQPVSLLDNELDELLNDASPAHAGDDLDDVLAGL